VKTAIALTLVLGLILIAFFGFHGCQNPLRVPIVHQQKLLYIQNQREEATFTCPNSDRQIILFASPTNGATKQALSGTVKINHAGTNVVTLRIAGDNLVNCNWLDKYALAGSIIENPKSADKWDVSLIPNTVYSIIVDNAPMGSSIWLHYIRPSGWAVK
jgi:hypothetical protein